MIHIYRADSELGVALFDLDTGKFLYGEICDTKRLVTFVNSFPEHEVIIYIDKAWQEEIQELFFLLPHLQDLAHVKTVRKLSPSAMIAKATIVKKKPKTTMLYLFAGVILGCLLLIPTSMEYKNSVLVQAESIKEFTEDFVQNQPNTETRKQLYTSLGNLYNEVRVETVSYSAGNFKVIFSSSKDNVALTDLKGFDTATLTKVSSLKNSDGIIVHIYELEGNL